MSPAYLAHLSNAYVGACAGAFGSAAEELPIDFLAGVIEKEYGACKGNLHTAGKRGYLVRSPGRAGGTITAKCAEELRKQD